MTGHRHPGPSGQRRRRIPRFGAGDPDSQAPSATTLLGIEHYRTRAVLTVRVAGALPFP